MVAVSVIVPVYNAREYLPECMESLLSQTFADFEVVCVDDGSTDGSAAILEEFAGADPRLGVLTQANAGVAAARRAGLERSTGEYVLFLDADDVFAPELLSKAYSAASDVAADVCLFRFSTRNTKTGAVFEPEWALRVRELPVSRPFNRTDVSGNLLLSTSPVVWNKMLSRAFLTRFDLGFPVALERAEDVPYSFLSLLLADRITLVDEPLVQYRTGDISTLQATVHRAPLAILQALDIVRDKLTAEGIYSQVERVYVEAALEQCLYALDALGAGTAFSELYETLQTTYLESLGMVEPVREYFSLESRYQQYRRVVTMTVDEYLAFDIRRLRGELSSVSVYLQGLERQLSAAKSNLERSAVEQARLSEEEQRLVDANRALEGDLRAANRSAGTLRGKLERSEAALAGLRRSRSYRMGHALASVPRALRRLVSGSKKRTSD